MENIKLTEKRKEIISLLHFHSIMDILRYYPYRYDHYQNDVLKMSLHEQKVSFEGKIASKVKMERITKGRIKTSFVVANKEQSVKVIMFNHFANTKFLYEGAKMVLIGKYNYFLNEISVSNFFMGELANQEKYTAIYSLPANVKDYTYRQFIQYIYHQALALHLLEDKIPKELLKKYKLISLKDALYFIHFPCHEEDLKQAYRYLKYEEFLNFCLLGILKRECYQNDLPEKKKTINFEIVKQFIHRLPFELTQDQKFVIKEILEDMQSKKTMSRLLQGDVGSGKTIVAFIALIANYTSGYQGTLMVPTDILARQHYNSFLPLLTNNKLKVSLLVSDMTQKEKKEVLEKIKNGNVDVIIGTHALIQENVFYHRLGLAIIDEQHRFGVKQRATLKEKGVMMDVLYMSATPIPRTLASTIYMDMSVSTIQNYPYQNRKIYTYFINENSIEKIKNFILDYLKSNQKIYVVCPSIDESTLEIANVIEIQKQLQREFQSYNIGLLHGKMTTEDKKNVLDFFAKGETQILVSTTVIEVGINVLNANMMIIYNAERFGLAQIHQLRGRIARYGNKGYCYLLSSTEDKEAVDRLNFISSTNDGFKISEYDLKKRGAGDMLGWMQSGKSPFIIANLIDDFNILLVASKDAKYIIENRTRFNKTIEENLKIIHNSEKYVD